MSPWKYSVHSSECETELGRSWSQGQPGGVEATGEEEASLTGWRPSSVDGGGGSGLKEQ